MPIYEYRCKACGYVFEDVRSKAEADDPAACPKCGRERSERMVSAFATSCGSGSHGGSSSCGSGGGFS